MAIITLLTDFGNVDAYVAQMKGQILSICPTATLIDITHAVPRQDVAYGSLLLAQSVPYFPDGTVHVCVVDPGVGTERDILALEVECAIPGADRPTRQRVVLPDNGLASLLLESSRVVAKHRVTERRYWRPVVSSTFHGRDIMGPVAAHWAAGQAIDAFGPECAELQSMAWPSAVRVEGAVPRFRGSVIALDHFGNMISNIPADWLNADEERYSNCRIIIGERAMRLPLARTYGQLSAGQAIVLVGSHGFVELAVVGGSAAGDLRIVRGDLIEIELLLF